MTGKKIVVVGSANVDITVLVDRLPKPGETLTGEHHTVGSGGKGANQAVAAAKLGANVSFVGRVGADSYGDLLQKSLIDAGVDVKFLKRDIKAPTGIALITVAKESGENTIVVSQGANGGLSPSDIQAAEDLFASAETLVISLEIPMKTVEAAAALAHKYDARIILNPAPARPLSPQLMRRVSILTPNEHEVALIAGDESLSPQEASEKLLQAGAETVIVTLGGSGAIAVTHNSIGAPLHVPSYPVNKVVDTTGAGDCYTGALAAALTEDKPLADAMVFAAHAAALSVTRAGAQQSMPTMNELKIP